MHCYVTNGRASHGVSEPLEYVFDCLLVLLLLILGNLPRGNVELFVSLSNQSLGQVVQSTLELD